MKILLFITTLSGGGAERIVQLLSGHWVSQGHHVTIVTMDHGAPAYSFSEKIDIIRIPSGGLNRGFLKIILLPLQAYELSKIIKRVKPDTTISFLVRANLVNVLSRSFSGGRKIIISHRNITQGLYGNGNLKSRVMLLLIAKLYKKADRIITISNGVKKSLELLGIDADRMVTIPNFVDPKVIDRPPAQTRRLAQDKPVIISIGRLIEQKDFPTLLNAFAMVRVKMDARLVILGQGPLHQPLAALADQLQISDDVHFAGWLDDPFVALCESTLFVLTSLYEGFGNVIIEAMACGLPVICTDCPGGPNDILGNGMYGKLVEIGNVEEIATSIIQVLGNPVLQEQMRQQSLGRVQDYNIDRLAPEYLKIVDTCR